MSLEILKKQIKEDKLQSVYLFYGAEEYLKKYYISTITKLIVEDENKELNFISFDGKTDVDSIIANCETLPMFSDKKLVIAKNSGLFKSKKGDAADTGSDKKSTKDKLSEYLENMPPYTCLILVESDIDKRLKLVNAIKKYGLIVELDYQKPADLVKWVIKVFKSYNKSIEQMDASYLVENSEYSMTELLNEIEKVVNFVGDKNQIAINDIEMVCNKTIKSRIFALTDAVSEGNISKALILLNDMAALKEPMQKVLFMIIRQIRMVYRIKLLRLRGVRDELAAKQMGLTPFVASKVISISKNLDISILEKAMYYSLELDESIKTGKITDRIAIELLIASMN
ncbi:MAG TPA: DNA polymerase III subunit delta [Ruminiclostridium sp.]